jgi:glutamate dehydrogenase/leucine dehydrogenase
MRHYPGLEAALEDVLKLSAGMTYKFAVPGFARGGGKAVILTPDVLTTQARTGLLLRYGELVKQLAGGFYTGPDVGTSTEDMDIIATTGAPYVHSRTSAAGGAGSSGPFTALGVFAGIQVACEQIFGDSYLAGRRVLVQGAGSVGRRLIELLVDAGATVMFSEVSENIVQRIRDEFELEPVAGESVYATDCDVFSPCALGGILNAGTIPTLRCRAIVGGANNQLATPEDAARLKDRGIFYAPDYVVSVGGAMAITGMEAMGWSSVEAEKKIVGSIQTALLRICELVGKEDITTEVAAKRIADEHLSSAS